MKAEKSLMIFGAGYLGKVLGCAALEKGWRVLGLTRNAEKAKHLEASGFAKVWVADLATPDWWKAVAEVPDGVVNCVSSGGGGLEGYRHSYIGGNRSIMGWVAVHPERERFKRSTLIYTGSTGVYPDAAGDWVMEEEAREGDGGPRGDLLLDAERVVAEAAPSFFRRYFILRLAGLYGPGRSFLINQVRERAVRGEPDSYLNLIRVEDAADAILKSLDAAGERADRIYNVADGSPAKKEAIVEWLASELGMEGPFFDPERAVSWRAAKNRRISTEAIRKELGWEPQYSDYRKGLKPLLTSV